MPADHPQTAILLLAAGASSRLGQPKQLLPFGSQTLLGKMAEVALSARLGPVVAVLGAFYEKTAAALNGLDVEVVKNENWADGMGGSIARGVRHLEHRYPETEALIIMLCDQPFVTPELLSQLVETQEKREAMIVASSYGGTIGPPVLFTSLLFGELASLKGKHGAKTIIRQIRDSLSTIPFDKGEMDLDSERDVEEWKKILR